MIVYTILVITLFFAVLSIVVLWRTRGRPASTAWPGMLLSLSIAVFIYLYGAWVFFTIYLKYVFAVIWLLAFIIRLGRKHSAEVKRNPPVTANLFFTVVFLVLSVLYFTGTTGKPYGIAHLTLPFKNGTYFVFQGGKGLPTNAFHYKLRTAIYAMDIVKLNNSGNRAKHIFSRRLEDYAIFGDTVYSPCNGRVIRTNDQNKDNEPPHVERGTGNINMVLIETDSSYVFLGHLKQGSVLVKEGDMVTTGQPLGCVGNSGFTLEPHLHIQVHTKTNPAIPWYKEKPLLIEFDGKSYDLFEVIKPVTKQAIAH